MASTAGRAEILLQIENCDLLLAQSEAHILGQQSRVDAMIEGSSERELSEEILETFKSLLWTYLGRRDYLLSKLHEPGDGS